MSWSFLYGNKNMGIFTVNAYITILGSNPSFPFGGNRPMVGQLPFKQSIKQAP
jgi:hypothetical protein